MTTITIVTDSYYPMIDGVARFVDALGQTFAHEGYKVNLVVPSIKGLPKFDYNSRPFEFIFLPTIPIKIKDYYICLPNLKLKSIIRDSDAIVVNSLAFSTGYVLFLNRFYNKPIIEFVHTDEREILHYTGNVPHALNQQVFKLLRKMTEKIHYFAVATNKFRNRALDYGVSPDKIFRVPFGYSPKEVESKHVKIYQKEHNINPNEPTVLYLGRLSDEKNITRLVDVMGHLSNGNNIQCLIAGDGYKSSWIRKQIKENDLNIKLLGRIPDSDLPVVYSLTDIFFSPSFHESLGFTIVEAMSYGVIPAVNGKYQEKGLNDTNCIYLDDITDIDGMETQILELLENPKQLKKMQQNALISSEQFSWTRFSEIWVDKVEEIINSESPG